MPRARPRSTVARGQRRPAAPSRPSQDTLAHYEAKRDFARTPEPAPGQAAPEPGPLTFVVQKHRASRLHYDLRLELDGVMKSWPVPRGPSLDPGAKRLAVMTEDHPLDYASFEGTIPKGEYGAGQVIVWDNGTYSPDEGGVLSFHDRAEAEQRMRRELAAGKLSIQLRGKKLKGSWALVKTSQDEQSWLLIKHRDDAADAEADVLARDRSVISGLTIEDMQAGRVPDRSTAPAALRPGDLPGAKRRPLAASLTPMQATLTDAPFSGEQWLFEPKLDGIRAIATVRDGEVELHSRRGNAISHQYPALAAALSRQPVHSAALDGEIVALDADLRPSFELLQQRMNLTDEGEIARADAEAPVVFFAFDLLELDGYDLRGVPLWLRRETLERVVLPSAVVRCIEHFDRDGEAAYDAAVRLGFEGVVAKRRDSVYEDGKRSRRWLKVKARTTDEFVVGGYTAGNGGRAATFGALVVGQYDGEGRLIPAGRVGSGFDERTLGELRARLDRLRRKRRPFAVEPEDAGEITWVKPELVVEVEFANWTSDGNLRAPVFKRGRDDKSPAEVQRAEVVAPLARATSNDSERPGASETESAAVAAVLEQLDSAEQSSKQSLTLHVEGHELRLTNLDKAMWPTVRLGRRRQRALTKRDLLVYFARMAPVLLPHLRDRPLTMTRYPNGVQGQSFYQKHYDRAPAFVQTFEVFADKRDQQFIVCDNLATLMWLGQIADLALHTSLARIDPQPDATHLSTHFAGSREAVEASVLNYPDFVLFDLDPYTYSGREAAGEEPELNRPAWRQTCDVALRLKELLDQASLSSFVKTSGATGVHVYVPVRRNLDYAAVRSVAETFGGFLVAAHPRDVTMQWQVKDRGGKVFFDVNQNARIKNLAAPYSPRAKPGAPVSMPLRWDELPDVYPTDFTILTAPARVDEHGDLWAHILEARHDLEVLLEGV